MSLFNFLTQTGTSILVYFILTTYNYSNAFAFLCLALFLSLIIFIISRNDRTVITMPWNDHTDKQLVITMSMAANVLFGVAMITSILYIRSGLFAPISPYITPILGGI